MRLRASLAFLLACLPALAIAQSADQRIREQNDSLARIRAEREELERQARELKNTAHDLSDEVTNLDRRALATARLIKSLERQLEVISADVDTATEKVARAEAELEAKHKALERHLVEIYKRGPMFTTEALLSAGSFGELVARYKYLRTLTLRDRALVARVEQLRTVVKGERDRLVRLQDQLDLNRQDREREEERLLDLKRQQAAQLKTVQARQKQVETRIAAMKRDEAKLASLIAANEAARKRGEAVAPATRTASSLKTSDMGNLDWPVEGSFLYTFGKEQTASNTTIRWNGVGIQAKLNTDVKAVASGKILSIGQFSTYGLTIVVEHGGGTYSVYGSLARADVKKDQAVAKGQVIGGAGVSDPDFPSHLHFEIRTGAKAPVAVDPAQWLRKRQ